MNHKLSARANSMRSLAAKLEMQFHSKDEFGLMGLLKDFRLFRKGSYKTIRHIIKKESVWLDNKIVVFDYRYKEGKRYIDQTVFFIQAKDLSLPEFYMKPETIFHKIGQWLGMKDINFEEYPKFSSQYWLKGEDEEYIRYSLNDDFLKYFTVARNWHVEGVGYFLILYRPGRLFNQQDILRFLKLGYDIYDRLRSEEED